MMDEDKVKEALRFLENITGGKSCDEIHARDLLREALAPDIQEWKPEPGELVLAWPLASNECAVKPAYYVRPCSTGGHYVANGINTVSQYIRNIKPHPTHLNKQPNTGVAPDCKFVWVKFVDGDCHVARTADLNWALTTGHRKVNVIEEFAIIE